mmetsp:Transcript_20390/g.68984  ORF Transcript_20390/g.68984 Transcript_20390/m.68984 type:complete len:233 (-) Transcript_20390:343-1041(-)
MNTTEDSRVRVLSSASWTTRIRVPLLARRARRWRTRARAGRPRLGCGCLGPTGGPRRVGAARRATRRRDSLTLCERQAAPSPPSPSTTPSCCCSASCTVPPPTPSWRAAGPPRSPGLSGRQCTLPSLPRARRSTPWRPTFSGGSGRSSEAEMGRSGRWWRWALARATSPACSTRPAASLRRSSRPSPSRRGTHSQRRPSSAPALATVSAASRRCTTATRSQGTARRSSSAPS